MIFIIFYLSETNLCTMIATIRVNDRDDTTKQEKSEVIGLRNSKMTKWNK